jgi:phage tail tape-measure protein
LNAAVSAGAISREYAQNLLDQDVNRYDANRNYPMEAMNIRLAALGGTQVPTTSTTKTPTSGNWLTGALGGALSGAAAGSTIPGIGTFAGAIGGGLLGGLGGY